MKKTINKLIQYAVHVSGANQIILFGSMAHNQFNVNSDIDLIIVADNAYKKSDMAERIKSFARELALQADIIIMSSEEVKKAKGYPISFLGSVIRDGKIIYQKN